MSTANRTQGKLSTDVANLRTQINAIKNPPSGGKRVKAASNKLAKAAIQMADTPFMAGIAAAVKQ